MIKTPKIDIKNINHKIDHKKYLFLDLDETLIYSSIKWGNMKAHPITTSITK